MTDQFQKAAQNIDFLPELPKLGNLLKAPIETLKIWNMRAKTRAALAELENHNLEDIGITRLQVTQESSKSFWVR